MWKGKGKTKTNQKQKNDGRFVKICGMPLLKPSSSFGHPLWFAEPNIAFSFFNSPLRARCSENIANNLCPK